MKAVFFAISAAVFYAVNMPCSKTLLNHVSSTMMAGLLYCGAGIGIGIIFILNSSETNKNNLLSKSDIPYVIGMIVLDILAPIFLMYGLLHTTSANASLLNNFEIVATTIIASLIFKESVSHKLLIAIVLITISSVILSFEDISCLKFSWSSGFILLATICWGFENNCTRKISDKNTYQIVTLKGICSGLGSLIIAAIIGEHLSHLKYIFLVLLLGFIAYGLSIFFYIKAQNVLGAAKTSAYYAVAPFVGSVLSFVFLKEELSFQYFIALLFMIAGSIFATADTLVTKAKES